MPTLRFLLPILPLLVLARAFALDAEPILPAPLDLAWQAAATIRLDEHDRTKAQAEVLKDRLQDGDLDGVAAAVDQIAGWRQGEIWVALGRARWQAGDHDGARAAANEAERIRTTVTDWPAGRLGVDLADLRRRLGDTVAEADEQALLTEREDQVADALRGAQERLEAGAWKEAVPILGAALWTYDVESAPLLLAGWVQAGDLAAAAGEAAQAAHFHQESARVVQAQPSHLLVRILTQTRAVLGDDRFGAWLDQLGVSIEEAAVAATAQAPHYAVSVLSAVAEDLAAIGRTGAALDWLGRAAEHAAVGEIWERPRLRARVALAATTLGEPGVDLALGELTTAARELAEITNPRPRALALVDQARAWHRLGQPVTPAVATLWQETLAGLEPRAVPFEVAR